MTQKYECLQYKKSVGENGNADVFYVEKGRVRSVCYIRK
jgi:hypothetical protein